jgi:hypothetical protein
VVPVSEELATGVTGREYEDASARELARLDFGLQDPANERGPS